MNQVIGIIGSHTIVGRYVVNALMSANIQTRILSPESPALSKSDLSTDVRHADLSDEESITAHLFGVNQLIFIPDMRPTDRPFDFIEERDGLAVILRAIQRTGVERLNIVLSLLYTAPQKEPDTGWVAKIRQQTPALVKGSGIPYSLFSHSILMEEFDRPEIRVGDRIAVPIRNQRGVHYVAASDVAHVIVSAVQRSFSENQEFPIQGPERLLPISAARQFARHFPHRPVIATRVPLWPLRIAAYFSQRIRFIYNELQMISRFEDAFQSTRTWDTFGKPEITLAKFAGKLAKI
ncbi:hypothetical protein EBR96_00470 [bacterium]|nr:hypothetical protein [bacterium]